MGFLVNLILLIWSAEGNIGDYAPALLESTASRSGPLSFTA
jgi:hypothetical protein